MFFKIGDQLRFDKADSVSMLDRVLLMRDPDDNNESKLLTATVDQFNDAERLNYKLVEKLSDFPECISDVITLANNTTYEINGDINLGTCRLEAGVNNTLFSSNSQANSLTYTGSGSLLTVNNQSINVRGLRMDAALGTIFDIKGSGAENIIIQEVISSVSASIISVEDINQIIMHKCEFSSFTSGFVLTGSSNNNVVVIRNEFEDFTGSAIDITGGVTNQFTASDNTFNAAAPEIGISADADSNLNEAGRLIGNVFTNGLTPIDGFNVDTPKWTFLANEGIQSDTINNFVLVQEKNDFPAPVAGVITLLDNHTYQINGQIDLGADRIETGLGNTIFSNSWTVNSITYTGAGSMFTIVDDVFTMRNLDLTAATGKLFDIQGVNGPNVLNFVQLNHVKSDSAQEVMTATDFDILLLEHVYFDGFTDGITITGANNNIFQVNNSYFSNHTNSAILLTGSTTSTIEIEGSTFSAPSPAVGITGDAGSANVTVQGTIIGCDFLIGIDALVGISDLDTGWFIEANTNIVNTNDKREYILVKSKDDFPAPVAGVITLDDLVTYELNASIDLGTDRIVTGTNNTITGENALNNVLIYTGTGDMITSTSNLSMYNVGFSASAGAIINQTGASLVIEKCFSITSQDLGTLTDCDLSYINECQFDGFTDGFVVSGVSNTNIVFREVLFSGFTNTAVDLTGATSMCVGISDCQFNVPSGAIGIDGDVSSANVTAGGRITGTIFMDVGTYVNNITSGDLLWRFIANSGVQNSRTVGSVTMQNNATTTTLAVTNTYVKVAGATVQGSNTERFTMTGNNELTSDDTQTLNGSAMIYVHFEKAAGASADTYEFALFQNSSEVTGASAVEDQNNALGSTSFFVPIVIAENDVFEVYVRNRDNPNDVIVESMQVIIQ